MFYFFSHLLSFKTLEWQQMAFTDNLRALSLIVSIEISTQQHACHILFIFLKTSEKKYVSSYFNVVLFCFLFFIEILVFTPQRVKLGNIFHPL